MKKIIALISAFLACFSLFASSFEDTEIVDDLLNSLVKEANRLNSEGEGGNSIEEMIVTVSPQNMSFRDMPIVPVERTVEALAALAKETIFIKECAWSPNYMHLNEEQQNRLSLDFAKLVLKYENISFYKTKGFITSDPDFLPMYSFGIKNGNNLMVMQAWLDS